MIVAVVIKKGNMISYLSTLLRITKLVLIGKDGVKTSKKIGS
jgi:hypothetical protein